MCYVSYRLYMLDIVTSDTSSAGEWPEPLAASSGLSGTSVISPTSMHH